MKRFYRRLAMINLKNNRQFYLPYLLTGTASVMMFYIMCAILENEGIHTMRGSGPLLVVLTFGMLITGICVCIFLLYTNSFIMKRRKKELGIYNILGMEKKHIARVMAWESVMLYLISVGGGLLFGILFHKLATMFLFQLTGLTESVPFSVSGWGCRHTVIFFCVIYLIMMLYNFLQVRLANPIELLHSGNVGEREPKTKWLSAAAGIVCIAAGYYLAFTVYGIMEAVNMFFLAVIFVIAGTYLLFINGSIALLKMLKKNQNYYYKTSHFISVSGMLYRMKRNAVGLASICILSTMVLVVVSTTVSMYAGMEDSLCSNYEKEVGVNIHFHSVPDDAVRGEILEEVWSAAEEQNRTITELSEYTDIVFVTYNVGNVVIRYESEMDSAGMSMLYALTKEDYEKCVGLKSGDFEQGEVIIASSADFPEDVISVFGMEYQIREKTDIPDNFPHQEMENFLGATNILYMIVADEDELERLRSGASALWQEERDSRYHVQVEIDGTAEEKKAYASALREALEACRERMGFDVSLVDSRAEHREEYMKLYGGFLFLGLFLGLMFLLITVLMIYYKQISEGFEDRERFVIMAKVGVSGDMIKSAVNAQVRTIFFLPITVAVIHLLAVFPMLKWMMLWFGLANLSLFAGGLAVTTAVFAVIYFLVFKLTSGSYYKIVRD